MGFFEKIGLGRKKKEQIPLLGDKKKKDIKKEVYSLKRNPYVRVMIFLLFILTSIFSLPRTSVNTGFVYRQLTPESEPFLEVHMRQVRKKNEESGIIEEKVFAIEAEDEAVLLYKKFLSEVIQ